ncbi:diguanylate cyclase [Cupriavidus sp. 2TAF22]|uniref:diguanylate cyclase n=1 Tax=unclassified Cupriavidus TaxID=2640874 RepID=UPI003F92CEF5
MHLGAPPRTTPRTVWRRARSRPRQAVVLCFAAVFIVTLVLAGRQYFLVRARELDLRAHRLELQGLALDADIRGAKRQMRFLRNSAQHYLAEQSAQVDPAADEPLRKALAAQDNPLWSLQVPDADAPVRGIGSQQLRRIPGLGRRDSTLLEDLKLSRVMSQLLAVQYRMSADLAHAFFVSATGVVVACPPVADEQVAAFVELFASSGLFSPARERLPDHDVIFDPVLGRRSLAGPLLLFATPVILDGAIRGAIVFEIPQRRIQDYLHAATSHDDTRALVDRRGTLIASSESTFTVTDESWLKTLPAYWSGLAVPTLFRAGGGMLSVRQDFLLYRKLENADLVLLDHVPAGTLFLAVVGQFSVPFAGIWLLLGLLLWATLAVVDQLLKRQMILGDQLRELTRVDALTRLANRRRLEADFDVLTRGRRIERPISLLMIDIDHFKHVNDSWGHAAGDEALKTLATVTRAVARPQDLVARYGGEEFCVLLPDTSLDEAARIAERMRLAIAQAVCTLPEATLPETAPGREIRFTVSIGVAELIADACRDLGELVAVADRRLYAAKDDGRNRVVAQESTRGTDVP